jgi:hypothetical protein
MARPDGRDLMAIAFGLVCALGCEGGDGGAARGHVHNGAPSADDDGGGSASCAPGCRGTCDDDGRCIVQLTALGRPTDLVLGGAHAYVSSCDAGGTVLSVALDGGDPVTLASGSTCAQALALADGELYVAGLDGSAAIQGVPVAGGAPTRIATAASAVAAIVASSDSVYWTTGTGALMRAARAGGAAEMIATCKKLCGRPHIAGTRIYWADPGAGAIRCLPLAGGSSAAITSGIDEIGAIAIRDDDVYFGAGYVLMKAKVSGGPAVVIATAAGAPVNAVAVDDDDVYFTSYSTIWKVARTGGAAMALAADLAEPAAIAVDDARVVWMSGGGRGALFALSPK